MNKIVLLSHCILNGCCEVPEASDVLRSDIVNILLDKKVNLIQLPCPELCFQGLERCSINPGDDNAGEYAEYCGALLKPIMDNISIYAHNNIEILGVIGIDTSPSCSTADYRAVMMKDIFAELERTGVTVSHMIDMPISGGVQETEAFLESLKAW